MPGTVGLNHSKLGETRLGIVSLFYGNGDHVVGAVVVKPKVEAQRHMRIAFRLVLSTVRHL
jgi:hypothetical protein